MRNEIFRVNYIQPSKHTVKDKFDTIRFLETFELNVYGTLGEFFSSYKKINKRNS